MFGKKKAEETPKLENILESLRKNEIVINTHASVDGSIPERSRFGGRPSVPRGFEWPRYNGDMANSPLAFLCQIDLSDIVEYDKEELLPKKGMLLFFYELESMRWGFDPEDKGCARVYYFENKNALETADFPDDLQEEYRVKEYDLSFSCCNTYPSFEELECHSKVECDWEEYDDAIEKFEGRRYNMDVERHKLIGYADIVQNEMLTECEMTTRGFSSGSPEDYQNASAAEKKDIERSATDWRLLFQMTSIQDEDYELMFGDCGNLYFYIRKQDLEKRDFSNIWLILQCC